MPFSYATPILGVFKRTYWSIDPFRDAKFVETFFGLTVRASQNWKMPADPFDVAATTDSAVLTKSSNAPSRSACAAGRIVSWTKPRRPARTVQARSKNC